MADQVTIDQVRLNLPTWIEEQTDWDDNKIGAALDSNNQNVLWVIAAFWRQRVADLSAITDMADAGTNRPLSQTYQHAMEQMRFWDSIAGYNATSVGKIKRRYRRRHGSYGLSEYGGVYGRVD